MSHATSSFTATVAGGNESACVVLLGELDMDTAPDLKIVLDQLIEDGPDEVVLDCSGLSFVDSSGIASLIAAQKRLKLRGRHLTVKSPRPIVVKVLEITDLMDFLKVDTGHSVE